MSAVSYSIQGGDYEHGGAASRALKEQLKKVGADPAVVRRAMVAAYEAEMNVVIHAHRGELRASLDNGQLEVEVIDEGPGIPDIAQAMKAGFSTASARAREYGFGAGMGLPNIKKNSDRFAIESEVGRGTRVSFTIHLRPQALYGAGQHSLHIDAARCRQALRCLHTCPTLAMRVRRNKPEVLDYLCIDCGACITTCPSGALQVAGAAGTLAPVGDGVLVVTAESLAQFGAGVGPDRVLAVLAKLGFHDVRVSSAWESALRAAMLEYARTTAPVSPTIAPACPAVVNLIEMRFPALIPHVAPFRSALEALQVEIGGRRALYGTSCPAQRTALLSAGTQPAPEVLLPAALHAAVAPHVVTGRDAPLPIPQPSVACEPGLLWVTGIRHVLNVLEAVENGQAGDVQAIEPWACDAGCFGSPLLREDAFLSRHRWTAPRGLDGTARAIPRARPLAARPGLRLDTDMAKAIQKLAKIDKLKRSLPGSDCAMCGAPTCAALAEDIVLGRASADACVRQAPPAGPAANQEIAP